MMGCGLSGSDRQLIDERRIHKFRLGGVSASLGHHLFRRGHADGEHFVLDDVGSGLVTGADTAPGRVHGIGGAVLVTGRQDKYRLGIGSGFETKNFAHTDSYYFLRNFRIPLPVVPESCSGGMLAYPAFSPSPRVLMKRKNRQGQLTESGPKARSAGPHTGLLRRPLAE